MSTSHNPLRDILARAVKLTDWHRFTEPSVQNATLRLTRNLFELIARLVIGQFPTVQEFKALSRLKNAWGSTDVLVIARGSSVDQLDTRKVCNLHAAGLLRVVTLNDFFTSDLARLIPADLHVLSDPAHHPKLNSVSTQMLIKKLDSDQSLLVASPWPHRVWPDNRGIRFNDIPLNFQRSSWDPRRFRCYVSNTGLKSVAMALHMTRGRVFVAGIDNDFPKNIVSISPTGLTYNYTLRGGETQVREENGTHALTQNLFDTLMFNQSVSNCFLEPRVINLSFNSLVQGWTKGDPLALLQNSLSSEGLF